MPFISSNEEQAQHPYVLDKTRVTCSTPLRGKQKYQVTQVGVKSKIDTIGGQRTFLFNSL